MLNGEHRTNDEILENPNHKDESNNSINKNIHNPSNNDENVAKKEDDLSFKEDHNHRETRSEEFQVKIESSEEMNKDNVLVIDDTKLKEENLIEQVYVDSPKYEKNSQENKIEDEENFEFNAVSKDLPEISSNENDNKTEKHVESHNIKPEEPKDDDFYCTITEENQQIPENNEKCIYFL